jgi:hypothetical protein
MDALALLDRLSEHIKTAVFKPELEYLGHGRYGIVRGGNLIADFDNFDDAMDELERITAKK